VENIVDAALKTHCMICASNRMDVDVMLTTIGDASHQRPVT
jgi:hypothetical protein